MKPSLLLNFVLHKVIIPRLSEACQLPHKIVCCQATVSNDIEALCILLLKRLIFAVCLTWYHFWEETLQKSVIFDYKLDFIYSKFKQPDSSWGQDILQGNKLAK